jgi:hypothetical protein
LRRACAREAVRTPRAHAASRLADAEPTRSLIFPTQNSLAVRLAQSEDAAKRAALQSYGGARAPPGAAKLYDAEQARNACTHSLSNSLVPHRVFLCRVQHS